jgi:hypothetical protein
VVTAKIRSKWYRPPSLRYVATVTELRKKQAEYCEWLAEARGWTPQQIDAYLNEQRKVQGDENAAVYC